MKQITVKRLFALGVFTAVSNLRFNESGYPYVTMINRKGQSNNVYFGRNSSERLGEDYAAGDDIKKELVDATLCETFNADDELRYKISLKGESEYSSEAELEELFGVQADNDFDIAAFRKEFQSADEQNDEQADEENEEKAKKPVIKTSNIGPNKPEEKTQKPVIKKKAGEKVK